MVSGRRSSTKSRSASSSAAQWDEVGKAVKEGDQNSADLSAAGKAVFLAGKVRGELEVDALTVRIHVLNHHVRSGDLMRAALGAGVVVEIDVDDDTTALDWCREPGSKSWRETKLERLVATASADASADDDGQDDTAPDDDGSGIDHVGDQG